MVWPAQQRIELLDVSRSAYLNAKAIVQSPLLETGDQGWLLDDSIRGLLQLNAAVYGDGLRFNGGLLKLTHPIRAAHRAYNFGPKDDYPQHSIAAAFIALAHDVIEDFDDRHRTKGRDKLILNQIMECWKGPKEQAAAIREDILALTDSPKLMRHEAFAEQCARASRTAAQHNYSPRAMAIRYLEKLDTLEGDEASAQLPRVWKDDALRFAGLGARNFQLIQLMSGPVGEKEMLAYAAVIARLRGIAARAPEFKMRGRDGLDL